MRAYLYKGVYIQNSVCPVPIVPAGGAMRIELPIKPLSVNEAFQGRRFKTKKAKAYDTLLTAILPRRREPGPFYAISYRFELVNCWRTDYDNLIKILQDCIVRQGIISDDRKIVRAVIEKYPAKKDEIMVEIESLDHWPDKSSLAKK